MERLTKTYSDGTHGANDNLPCGENSYTYKGLLLEALGKYEDAEEQGLLLRLPCKVGDTVWVITSPFNVFEGIEYNENLRDECYESFISSVTFYKNSVQYRINAKVTNHFISAYYCEQDFGKTVFLTQEEVEQKLKEKEMGIRPLYSNYSTKRIIERLTEYEEAEEQGLVAVLPVPIGTTVYEFEPLNKIVKGCTARTVIKYTMYDDSIWFNFADGFMKNIEDFGKTIFLTREAAEQKLKEYEK